MKKIIVLSIAVLLSIVGNSWAQTQAPNRRDVVEQVSAADPARFACAHVESRSCKSDWIKAVAAALHAIDPKWGLNGKRGNPDDISMDVVTYRLGPTDRHVEAFDICGACGGPSPQVVWSNITNYQTIGQPGTAVWVRPSTSVVEPPPPPQTPVDLKPILDALATLTAKIDTVAALALSARDSALDAKAAADMARVEAEHAKAVAGEIRQLDVPSLLEQFKPFCVTGKVPKAFGGSSTVVLCPQVP